MIGKRSFSLLLAVMLVALLAACAPKKPPADGSQPSSTATMPDSGSESGSARGDDDFEGETLEPEWTDSDSTEVEKLSATEIERLAEEFNLQGALRAIFFPADKSELTDNARKILAANAAWLRGHPDFAVLVAGHCDDRNTEEYNLALGERRAESVRAYLISLGVVGARVETISYGEEQPVDRGQNESAWSKNRRAEFEVKPL